MSMWKRLMTLAAVLMLGVAIAGCNTMEGAGEDIEEGGEAIEDAAD